MVFWDKQGREPQVWQTPDVLMVDPGDAALNQFEAEHLRRIGVPFEQVMEEIRQRQKHYRSMLDQETVAASHPDQARREGGIEA